jgi:hypothetical protein
MRIQKNKKVFALILTTRFRDVFSSDSDCQPSLARNPQYPGQIPLLPPLTGLLHTASKAVTETINKKQALKF